MGKHAAPRTSPLRGRTAQRAVAVSAGTFVLCLGAAAPAVATSGLPTPPPLPQPIVDTVQTVTDIAGVANPIAPAKAPKGTHHHKRDAKQEPAKQPTLVQGTTTSKPPAATAKPATAPYLVSTYPVSGLRAAPATRTAQIADRAPAMASAPTTTRIIQTAGERMLGQLPGLPPTQDTSRILLIAMAMTIVGALSSGHIKAAQSRALA